MKADLFYTKDNDKDKDAIPLHFIPQAEYEAVLARGSLVERNYFNSQQFKGALGDTAIIYNSNGVIEKVYVGSGDGQADNLLAYAALRLPPGCYQTQEKIASTDIVSWALAQYRFLNYKKQTCLPRQLVVSEAEMNQATALVNAVFLVRDLINAPPNDMNPNELAKTVEHLAGTYNAQVEQWVGDDLVKANFPAIHAVGRASAYPPRLISLRWGDKTHPAITLIGKGVSFDTGGLDIKSSSSMRLMKKDMAGAAHAIGMAQWIMERKLPVYLQVLIPAVENSIGPNAFRPSDVLTMRNGLTVEVDNTDAEGRLIVADALVKACEEKTELLIDFTSLTGAARAAVGTEISALFCNDEELAAEIFKCGQQVNDPIWRLPLYSGYEDLLSSSVADMSNCGSSSFAGAITAGLFLQRFITPSTSWMHFDIMGWSVGNKPGKPEGGEAMALRAVAHYLLKKYG